MLKAFKNSLAVTALAGFAFAFAPSANAALILAFGQSGSGNTVTGTTVAGSTTIVISAPVIITSIITGGGPFSAVLTFTATNTGVATTIGTTLEEHFSGAFSITSGATNYLSGSFIDLLAGTLGGHSLTFGATTPPSIDVLFNSNVIPLADLGLERAIALAFTNVLPSVALCGTTICSFTAGVSGNMSANVTTRTPEPATLGLLGLGLAALGFARRRKTG